MFPVVGGSGGHAGRSVADLFCPVFPVVRGSGGHAGRSVADLICPVFPVVRGSGGHAGRSVVTCFVLCSQSYVVLVDTLGGLWLT